MSRRKQTASPLARSGLGIKEYSDHMMPRARAHGSAGRLTLLVSLVLVLLTPIAFASPPDPSWIPGLYDGADFDDVVLVVTSGAGIVELTTLGDVSPAPP